MITPSATSPTRAACSGVPIPKPTATGTSASALVAGDELGERGRELRPLAGRADGRDDVDEAAGGGADPRPALGRGRRRQQRHQRQPGRVEGGADVLGLVERQVGDDRPGGPGGPRQPANSAAPPWASTMFDVDHQHDRDPVGDRAADLERAWQRRPAGQRRRRRGVDRRPVGERVGERHPELDQVGPASA